MIMYECHKINLVPTTDADAQTIYKQCVYKNMQLIEDAMVIYRLERPTSKTTLRGFPFGASIGTGYGFPPSNNTSPTTRIPAPNNVWLKRRYDKLNKKTNSNIYGI